MTTYYDAQLAKIANFSRSERFGTASMYLCALVRLVAEALADIAEADDYCYTDPNLRHLFPEVQRTARNARAFVAKVETSDDFDGACAVALARKARRVGLDVVNSEMRTPVIPNF